MPALLTSALLVWAPGAAVLAVLAVPARWGAVLAPGVTAGLVGGGALLGLPWGVPSAAGVLAAALLLAVAARGRRGRRGTVVSAPTVRCAAPLALAAGGVVLATTTLALVLALAGATTSGVNQLWDAAWHANLTTWVLATGDAAPTAAGGLFGAGWRDVEAVYPSGLHAMAALVVIVSGCTVVQALHAVVLVHAAVVLPAAVAASVWELAQRAGATATARGAGAGVAAVVAVLPEAFPLDHLWRPGWPTTVGFTLVVVTGAAALRCARALRERGPFRPAAAVAVVAVCVTGTAAVHPSGAVALALAVGVAAVGRAVRPGPRRPARVVAAAVAVALAGAGSWLAGERVPAVASLFAYDYRDQHSLAGALDQVLGLDLPVAAATGYGVPDDGAQVALGASFVAALLVVLAAPGVRWLGALWVLLVLAAADTVAPVAPGLHLVTGWFYAGQARLAALVAIAGAVLTGVAVARAAPWLARRRWVAVTAAVLATGLVVGAAAGTAARAVPRVAAGYADRVVGSDQQQVMRQLARMPLPAGGRVLNDPIDGSAWLYALTGVVPLFTHYEARRPTGAAALLLERLRDVDTDPAVRAALEELGVCYVYANEASVSGRQPRAAGFAGLDGAASLQLVARAGAASAYRVVPPVAGC